MENVKQYQISFEKGMTNVPSDVICSDNEAAELVGMTFENGELKPIQDAYKMGSLNGRILYVHHAGTNTLYIVMMDNGVFYRKYVDGEFVAGGEVDNTLTSVKDVKAIGNTLIINTDGGMIYYLWNGNGYTKLGDKIPEPSISLKLYDAGYVTESQSNDADAIKYSRPVLDTMEVADHELWNNFVYGLYTKLKKDANGTKCFTMPFAARYALELYDGSLIYHSSPILFFPSRTKNFYLHATFINSGIANWTARMNYCQLKYSSSSDYSDWKDIVKGVKLFVSDEIDVYNTSTDAKMDIVYSGSLVTNDYIKAKNDTQLTAGIQLPGEDTVNPTENNFYCEAMTSIPFPDILNTLAENSLFYELCTLNNTSGVEKTVVDFKGTDLQNITARTQMTGDYFSHNKFVPNFMYPYNGRLHIADVSRSIYSGYMQFTGHDLSISEAIDTYTIYVNIKTSDGERVATKQFMTSERIGAFLFYPDPRAYSITVYSQNNAGYRTVDLKEHPGLNGAYYIESPLNTIQYTSGTPSFVENMEPESIPNKILVSEVDNPFVFSLNGYVTVGNGTIMGMAANTAALGQGQFGQHPLFVFSTDGIWALSTNTVGTYTSVHPFSREVCNNANSITQTDNAIFFSSEKGLMIISGNTVKCVSEQMNGKNLSVQQEFGVPAAVQSNVSFKDYLKTCKIAYDYKDRQLWLIGGANYHYVFNMNGGTISKVFDSNHIYYTADNYPDTLIQVEGQDGYDVLSLLNKPDINSDESTYDGYLLTRPIKFKSVLTLKSIRQMKHILLMNGSVSIKLFASNDCLQWVELHSLRGKPWKYYRIAYTFTNMKATDRFAGTVFLVEERRTEKLR